MNQLIKIVQEIMYLGAIASIPAVLILVIKKLFHKTMSPKWHYYIWALLIIRLLIPYLPNSSFSVLNLVYTVTVQSNLLENQMEETILYGPNKEAGNPAKELQTSAGSTAVEEQGGLPQQPSAQPESAGKLSYQAVLALLWMAGVIVLGGYTIYANIAFGIKLRKYYRRLGDPRIEAIFQECKKLLNVKGQILLYTSPIARTPSLYTAFRTRILLSEEHMRNLSDQEIRYIFLHELTHYKRKDIIVNWLLMLLQTIYFFQPLLWYAFFKIHEDCEISCDAEVLKYFGEDEHQEYGSTILKLLRLQADSRFIPVTAGIGKHKSSYRRRIIMIKQFKKYRWTNTLVTLILILTVGLVGLTGCDKASNKNAPANDQITSTGENAKDDTAIKVTPTPMITEAPIKDEQKDTTAIDENNPTKVEDTTEAKPAQTADEPQPAEVAAGPAVDQTPAVSEEPSSVSASQQEAQTAYYGDWTISKVLAYGQSGTYSKEDAEGLIGKAMSFSAESATCFGDQASYLDTVAKKPTYTASDYTSADFIGYYRMSFEKLGITGDKVTEIVATDSKGNGATFLIKDENTLIVVGGGTYFELVRK
ncbi:MAG: peptidase BlaR1 [Firmicutes bacterium]|nr:peptidase BlaR1 [Bacillota bacterium]